MRALLLFSVLFFTQFTFADIAKIAGQDGENICATIRHMYQLQTSDTLAMYPLAEVVQLKPLNGGSFEYVLGNADESVSCLTAEVPSGAIGIAGDSIKIMYNPEVSSFAKDRTINNWQVYKAYNVQGALADNICAQLETFNTVEEQALIPASKQVFFTMENGPVENIFGLLATVAADKYVSCGTIDGVRTIQFTSVDAW